MPAPISLAQKMAKKLTNVRKAGTVSYLRPDGKTQVTVEYDENNKPIHIDTVVLSTQHDPDVTLEQIRKDMIELVIKPTLPADLFDENTRIFVNPTGRFVIGGPQGDSGLTGRKIIVDTYGRFCTARRAAHSPVRTRPRLTVLPLTLLVTWRRTSLLPVWQTSARYSSHTPSA